MLPQAMTSALSLPEVSLLRRFTPGYLYLTLSGYDRRSNDDVVK
jgi:hypothetical protein